VKHDRIAYTCFQGSATRRDICEIDPDGSNRVAVITKTTQDEFAALSPDGTKIVFTSDEFGPPALFTANADGTNQAPLGGNNRVGRWPAWSPDGSKIAFSSGGGLYLINPNGTGVVQIVADSNGVERPAWAPDGKRIVFGTTFRLNGGKGIFVVNPDGTGLQPLTTGVADGFPAYSADGARIAFTVVNTGIAVMNADGSNRATILPNNKASSPSWSPNGQEITFTMNGGPAKVWIMSATGANARQLQTGNPDGDFDPAWGSIIR
jgi:Tol biopolymer transport system component